MELNFVSSLYVLLHCTVLHVFMSYNKNIKKIIFWPLFSVSWSFRKPGNNYKYALEMFTTYL